MNNSSKNNEVLHKKLVSLGFTPNQASLYITLIRLGEQKAGELIERTGLQRSVVYSCLQVLIDRQLIYEKNKAGVATFAAKNPKELVKEQEFKLNLTEQVAHELEAERMVLEHEAHVYQGDDIITLTADKSLTSKKGQTVYFFGSSKFGVQANLEKYWDKYHKERASKDIKAKILYDRFTPIDILNKRNASKGCEARYLPLDVEIPISFTIWEDHVAILVPGKNPPTAFFIKNQDTSDTLVEYFNYLWKQASIK